jgi:hypothetical protein
MSPLKPRSKSVSSSLGVEELELDASGQDVHLYIDPATERKLVRKLDWRLIPWLCLLYLISFLDRTNIGNAKIQGIFIISNPSDKHRTWKGLVSDK